MWKKFLAASAVASGIIGLLGGGSAFADPVPYNPGDVLDITSGDYTICYNLSDTMDLSGPVMVRLWGPKAIEYELEPISPQDLGGGIYATETCEMTSQLTQRYTKMQLVLPMGLSGVKVGTNGGTYFSFDFSHAVVSDKYLRSYGSSASKIHGVRATVNFAANGGSGAMDSMSGFGPWSWVTLPENTLTRTGYKFTGWNTKADGTGTSYSDGGKFQVTPQMIANGPIELYAQWEKIAELDRGGDVNVKIKKLAGTNASHYGVTDSNVKSIREASALPAGFDTSDDANIISASTSPEPIYAWFDNSDGDNDGAGDGVIYLYTDADTIMGGRDMGGMFYCYNSLTDISGLASWDTSSTRNMSDMFRQTRITNVNALTSWDTSSVTNMSGMFMGNRSLADISALANWKTESVENMRALFSNATTLSDISALASWDTSSVTDMAMMFESMVSLTSLSALASWDTSSVTVMTSMFEGGIDHESYGGSSISSLTDISALASWDTSSVKRMDSMFQRTSSLTDISALAFWDTSSVTNMRYMFSDSAISSVEALRTKQHTGKDYISWDTSSVTDMSWMFYKVSSLTDISGLANWNTSSVTDMDRLFEGTNISNVGALASWDTSSVMDMSDMFYEVSSLADISGLASWNTSSVTDMSDMFRQTSITNVNALTSWDTSNVEDMSWMFSNNTSLTDISGLANWNTSSVTDMSCMFRQTSITNVNALRTERHAGNTYTSWDTSNVEGIDWMFCDASSLTDISALASWNTSSVTNMSGMFFSASSLSSVSALENWNTSSVTNMNNMFYGVSARPLPSWYH